MPEEKPATAIKLSPQQIADMKMSAKSIEQARKELNIMKHLGMDVSMIEEKLTWAEEVSQTLLKEFSG